MEQIITNMNLLNRSVEGIIAVNPLGRRTFYWLFGKVGKEFESVSTLWRSFHEVLAKGEELPQEDDIVDADEQWNWRRVWELADRDGLYIVRCATVASHSMAA